MHILLCKPPSALSAVLYLSVLRAGAIAVLCNPKYADLEPRHALEVSEPQIVIGPTQACSRIIDMLTRVKERVLRFATTDLPTIHTGLGASGSLLKTRRKTRPKSILPAVMRNLQLDCDIDHGVQ
jgi:acyl-CoA synthetase (AMP-forming)/AMP-acid ligase II